MDEPRNCEPGPHDFFFNFMVRMNMEGGRGWLVIYSVSFIFFFFFWLCSNEFFLGKKKKKEKIISVIFILIFTNCEF